MTGPVTFGDLLDQARHHLDAAGRIPGRPGNEQDLLDAGRGMHAIATVIGQYFRDILGGYAKPSERKGRTADRLADPAEQWAAAFLLARRAALNAARHLGPTTVLRQPGVAATERGRQLDSAVLALVTGRDLLYMHTTTRPNGKRTDRSSWAPVIRSPACRQAIAAEMAALARQAAAVGAALVTIPAIRWDQTTDSRKAMHNASQSLRVLHGAIEATRQQNPVKAVDRELVRAIPVRVTPDRRLPDGTENINALCDGVITAAERLRQSVRLAAERKFSAPDLNVESLRRAAAASTTVTHNCAKILAALAEDSTAAQPDAIAAEMTEAVASTKQARGAWLRVALALNHFTSDVPGRISTEAADAHDLALWSGRLAHADSAWTPANGPSREGRSVAELASTPDAVAMATAAVHHAADSLQHLAAAHQPQAQMAARGGRLLVPTESLQPGYYIASRYTPAPPSRANSLDAAYKDVRTVGLQAAASVAAIAEMTNASSRTISRVSEVAQGEDGQGEYERKASWKHQPAEYHSPDLPGPVERSLQSIGITNQHQLRHAAAIDRAGEQLILDTCADLQYVRTYPVEPSIILQGSEKASIADLAATVAISFPVRAAERCEPEREP
jgi:hypothetical protein